MLLITTSLVLLGWVAQLWLALRIRAALPVLEAQARLLPHVQRAHLLLSDCRRRLGLLEEALDSAYAAIDPRVRLA